MKLIVSHLTKKMNGKLILSDVSFQINAGECLGVVGTKGTGKTTLVRIIRGIYQPTSGIVMIDGCKAGRKEYTERIRKVVTVPQQSELYELLTVWENVEFYCRIYYQGISLEECWKKTEIALRQFDLYGVKDLKITYLSGDLRQRLVFARAIVADPELLILDEPFQRDEIDSVLMLEDCLLSLKKKGTSVLVLSSDQMMIEKISDRVLRLGKEICDA